MTALLATVLSVLVVAALVIPTIAFLLYADDPYNESYLVHLGAVSLVVAGILCAGGIIYGVIGIIILIWSAVPA